MIRIVHLITDLDTGGAEMMLFKLLSSMDNERYSHHVISLTSIGSLGEKILETGVPVHALNMPNGRLTAAGLLRLWKLLRSIRPAVLQTWLYHADLLGLIFGKLSGIKNIFWNIRCSYMDLDKYRFSTKWTIKLCSLFSFLPKAIITNSRAAVEFHTNLGYRARHWITIPNGFDLNIFRPDEQARQRLTEELGIVDAHKSGFSLIGLVARYDPMKDHSTFIKAACSLLGIRNDVYFVLAGRGIDTENRMLTDQIPESFVNNFHLLGERNDIETVTASLDIATSASLGEGFPNVIGEAMSCGVPCVVTDVGDSAYIVGDTGIVVPPSDPEAMAEAWKHILSMDKDEYSALSLSARQRIMSSFSIDTITKQYEGIYADVLEKSQK